jgi:NAD(P)-dependent dehydrogenase (short-subunit alcohol dehydrogenase family)
MNLGLKDKVVLITGATQGIGLSIAQDFSSEFARVILVGRSKSKIENALNTLDNKYLNHLGIDLDLTITENCEALFNKVSSICMPDIIIHNLGGTLNFKSSLSSYEDWLKVIDFNVGIPIKINNLFVPQMKLKKQGRIVHVSSISGISLRGSAPYAASKTFLNSYTQCLARELAIDNIVVSAVMPGAIYAEGGHWDNVKKNNPTMMDDFLRHHHAVGRLGLANEISPWVLFLSSKYASFAQGALINIDGGTM